MLKWSISLKAYRLERIFWSKKLKLAKLVNTCWSWEDEKCFECCSKIIVLMLRCNKWIGRWINICTESRDGIHKSALPNSWFTNTSANFIPKWTKVSVGALYIFWLCPFKSFVLMARLYSKRAARLESSLCAAPAL